jgi:hypothetical protein
MSNTATQLDNSWVVLSDTSVLLNAIGEFHRAVFRRLLNVQYGWDKCLSWRKGSNEPTAKLTAYDEARLRGGVFAPEFPTPFPCSRSCGPDDVGMYDARITTLDSILELLEISWGNPPGRDVKYNMMKLIRSQHNGIYFIGLNSYDKGMLPNILRKICEGIIERKIDATTGPSRRIYICVGIIKNEILLQNKIFMGQGIDIAAQTSLRLTDINDDLGWE